MCHTQTQRPPKARETVEGLGCRFLGISGSLPLWTNGSEPNSSPPEKDCRCKQTFGSKSTVGQRRVLQKLEKGPRALGGTPTLPAPGT